MALLGLYEGAKAYADRLLFTHLSLELHPGTKIGLVGPNGSGKTTVLRILAGLEPPDAGRVTRTSAGSVGYLRQDVVFDPGETVLAAALKAFAPLWSLEREMRALEAAMADRSGGVGPSDLARYGDLQAQFEAGGGYTAESRAQQTLAGLGFGKARMQAPCTQLSGGERVRLALTRLLLQAPDVLLLDEPTNHLDLPAIQWLEEHLRRSPSAALVVSHDRHFLDAVTFATLEMSPQPKLYSGNYSQYLRLRGDAQVAGIEAYRRAQAELPHLRAYIAGCRAAFVPVPKNRLRRLAELEAVPAPDVAVRTIQPLLSVAGKGGGSTGHIALEVSDLRKAYGGRDLLGPTGFSSRVPRADRIGLVGPNGSGKSTLLRILRGELQPDGGSCRWASGMRVGWLPQSLEGLDPDRTLIEQLTAVPGVGSHQARAVLARFLFEGDRVFTRTGDCSGGERCRIALARLMLEPWDALLLDEPTNHLDLETRRAVEDALAEYPGTVLVASHDRFFLDRACWRLWVFGDGIVTDFEGNFSALAERERGVRQSAAELAAAIRHAEARAVALRAKLSRSATFTGGRGRRLAQEWKVVQEELAALQAQWRRSTQGDEPAGR